MSDCSWVRTAWPKRGTMPVSPSQKTVDRHAPPRVEVCPPCSCTGPRATSTARWPASDRPDPAWRRRLLGLGCPSRGAWLAHPAAGSRVAESTWATASVPPGSGSLRPVEVKLGQKGRACRMGKGVGAQSYTSCSASHCCGVATFGAATDFTNF